MTYNVFGGKLSSETKWFRKKCDSS